MTQAHRMVALCTAWMASSLFLGACANREHMRDDYGVKVHAFLQKQHVYADAAVDSPKGLDSEEAALIQATYRKDLGGGKSSAGESDQVIVLGAANDGKAK